MKPTLPEKVQYHGTTNAILNEADWEQERTNYQAEIAELQSECATLSMQEEAMLQQVSLEVVQAIENAEDREAMRNAEHEDMISQLQTCLQQAEEQMNDPPPTSLGPIAHDTSNG